MLPPPVQHSSTPGQALRNGPTVATEHAADGVLGTALSVDRSSLFAGAMFPAE